MLLNILNTYICQAMNNQLLQNDFIGKFLATSPLSDEYKDYKDLVHDGYNLDIRDPSGIPLLCHVIKYNDGDKYLDLLKGGAWVNIQDKDGKSPIVYAAELHDNEKIKKLLLYGAAVNKKSYSFLPMDHLKRSFLYKTFNEQACYQCNRHYFDLCNIPCVNRHFGYFICMNCYEVMCVYNRLKCPICARTLGKFGF